MSGHRPGCEVNDYPWTCTCGAGATVVNEPDKSGACSDGEEPSAVYLRMAGRLLGRAALADLPQPEPLIADTVDRYTVTMLAGRHGTGKTFLALDWSLCVATGSRWQGREVAAPGRVLYVASEGAYGLHQRIAAWEYAWHVKVDDDRFNVLPRPFNFGDDAEVDAIGRIVRDAGVRLLVVDTLARCAVGLDENSARDMGRVIDAASELRSDTNATVLLVHHTGKDGVTVRGSSALEGGADTVYLTEGDAACVKLSRTKRKDGPTPDAHTLRLKVVAESCVVESIGSGSSHETTATDSAVLKIVCDTAATGPLSKAELRDMAISSLKIDRATAYRSISRLVTVGLLRDIGTAKAPKFIAVDEGFVP